MNVVEENVSVALAMAAFAGVSWYIGIEIGLSLFFMFKRRRGLYFWSCALGIWGVILQTLFIILADFGIWTNMKGSITMIYLSWAIMVIPQSWILYSRLHLITQQRSILNWVRAILTFDSIILGVTTIPLGILTQTVEPSLYPINNVWDRLQTTAFFVQETTLSVLYIWQTRRYLHDLGPLLQRSRSSSSNDTTAKIEKKRGMLNQLIHINILIICLDITLLGIQNGNLFYLAGAFKPAVYGVKLKLEFVILNRLVKSLHGSNELGSHDSLVIRGEDLEDSGIEMSRVWDDQRPSIAGGVHRQTKPPVTHSSFDIAYLDADQPREPGHSPHRQGGQRAGTITTNKKTTTTIRGSAR